MPRSWANAILKLNRSLLKKRHIRELKDVLRENSGTTMTKFKEVSPFELKRIKENIRQEAEAQKKREIGLYIIAFIISILLMWWIKRILW